MIATKLEARLDAAVQSYFQPDGMPSVDFSEPRGEPALAVPDSLSWEIFKNPVSLFIGGVAAVILELAERRVRAGVWDHTSFRTDPVTRLKRTGLAAMMTVYGPRSAAERMISHVARMHARVSGTTADGRPYRADDVELLDWVQATASFGFVEAYGKFVRPLSGVERDRFYAEAAEGARLYGALGAPVSEAELEAQFEAMAPKLERSEVVFEFLDIIRRAPAAPALLRPVQDLLVRAAVEIVPPATRQTLGLDRSFGLNAWQGRAVTLLAQAANRIVLKGAPPAQAAVRLGLPPGYAYRRDA